MDLSGKTLLVVGASGILGAEFSNQLSARGANVLGSARTNESAAKIPDSASLKLLLDLEDPNSIRTMIDYLRTVDQLAGVINAAGVVGFGPAQEVPQDLVTKMNQINYLGPMRLFSELKEKLAASDESFIVNLTGIVAQTPMPNLAHYSASKSAIHGFLLAATREWRRSGIKVHSSLLGHTETGLAQRALFGQAPNFPLGLAPSEAVEQILGEVL